MENQGSLESCVFSPRHTKIPETHYFVDFITGIIAFSRPLFQKVSRASAKFSRLSFPGFLRVKLQAIFKELCQGHFLFVTGEFKNFLCRAETSQWRVPNKAIFHFS